MIQLRLKHASARTLAEIGAALVAALPVPVIINDRTDVAVACGAAGVHVGADDLPVAAVRRLAPPGFLVGVSIGSEAEASQATGADYAGIGPVYGSLSKLDAGEAIGLAGLWRVARAVAVPAVAIGGITQDTAGPVMAAGAAGIAVIAAVFGAPDPEQAARRLRQAIDRAVAAVGSSAATG